MLTNFHTKIFHAVGDVQTADWASGLVGRRMTTFVGGSMAPMENFWDEMMGRQKVTTSTSEHYEAILQPNEFMNGLRTGGAEHGGIVDGLIVRSGQPFSTGENFLRVEFRQEH